MKSYLLRYFTNLNTAIILLLTIACSSILGTIIEQDQTLDYYKVTYDSWKIISLIGLDHVYTTVWYISLLIMFSICLISCSFTQQYPELQIARRCFFKTIPIQYLKQKFFKSITNITFYNSLNKLKQRGFTIFQQNLNSYCYKGILGRFAPIIVHISILIILCGSFLMNLGNFNAQELITKGEIFQIRNLLNFNLSSAIPEFPIRINDFWIEYEKNLNIKQYYSDISVLQENGIEETRKTISVNIPLHFNKLSLYQNNWEAIGIRLLSEQDIYQLPLVLINQNKNLWFTWFPDQKNIPDGILFVFNNLEGSFNAYRDNGEFIGWFSMNTKIKEFKNLQLLDFIQETGLQIKTDFGISIVYSGFGILMLSILLSYISYTQFWLLQTKNIIWIGGNTNRSKLDLKFLFLSIILEYYEK
tara:strand:+ start:3617 stop:4864 length:1248 start_codon:yes stop_codon:yes gene_type:complete